MVEKKLFLPNLSIKIVFPNVENMIIVPKTKAMEIATCTQVCLISWMTINYKEMVERKAVLQITSMNIVHPNEENMIVMPITTRMEIIISIQNCLI